MTHLQQHNRTVLVLGATGGVGGAVSRAMANHGWIVRAMVRDIAKAETAWKTSAFVPHFISGDAMVRDDVIRAATMGGAVDTIIHAVNPPGYRNWGKLVLPMMDNTIAAARAAGGARLVLPGTVYNYDPATTQVIDETTPQNTTTRKGQIRVALEQRLADAAADVPSLIVRAGDFYGPGTGASWFAQAMITAGKPVQKITSMAPGVPHTYAYLPDLAETFARLLGKSDNLHEHEIVQFEGTWDANGRTMVEAIRAIVGRAVPEKSFPWWLMRLLAPFGGFPKEAVEIEPVWRFPTQLDNRRLIELLGQEPRTPLNVAIERSLIDMGCIAKVLPTSSPVTA